MADASDGSIQNMKRGQEEKLAKSAIEKSSHGPNLELGFNARLGSVVHRGDPRPQGTDVMYPVATKPEQSETKPWSIVIL